jgi:SAM-dependent methyltransferase
VKLFLGCGREYRDGWVHVDRCPLDHVDVVHDLNVIPWPFDDDSVDQVDAIDVVEHLDDVVRFMNECWRILRPGGILAIQAVSWQSENLWRDPTHKRGFHRDTFLYFDPRTDWGDRYGRLYTQFHWRVVCVDDDGDSVRAEMMPRKGSTV